ncbi:phosphoesterase [bacterium (Candidatus Blackallbacteria) CG17_big_fil_post_rev_8_21_14_2_50_48_46]|uniref:Phosphoesterase n=1 Tax=bacterium (Candidatus Blackallbacteria) CG17_big_fil_post_rev_8_21_14_2_50_48_46 TaxID=2014261 RepID=A0A2M7G5C5_9BACT|nr:MAG: phosphoesterase [bacterium (Candidatus Blackallbacteria) CG18_big_fil_WC_8_21_14_2_50_49_26]PIW17191.1 MAG: phosphoesterase [bacterium (Candidatus Blackallbacteria) CG17_big_fil_post_rev_8_21_14_2_50_48_46]PIW50982.1 MAG: phosphoesterase [bacterium (Candidatus Blackallbacteria) CG13_big_fil_rev_8_21_14_2_50_49_14]
MSRYVLYHANCPDGFGAAWAAWKKFSETAIYIPMRHGATLPEIPSGSEVYILDFSFDRETLLELSQRSKLKVLDHHKTALAELKDLDFAEFDMHRSGAVMTWQYFFPEEPIPELLKYIQDQDLWTWSLPDAHEITTALSIYPMEFEVWNSLEVDTLREEGKITLRYKHQLIENLGQRVDWFEILGHEVPGVNTPLFASELGNNLCLRFPEAPFAMSFSDQKGLRKFSLRSIGEFDVSAICREFGGGGHRNASGFALPLEQLNTHIKRIEKETKS